MTATSWFMPIEEGNRRVNLLLVEDHLPDIVLTKKAFHKGEYEYDIQIVRDGEQALSYLFQSSPYENAVTPDLILLDINLPKKSGHEVLKEIKHKKELASIPVLILSSSESEQDKLKSYELFANSFFVKPSGLSGFIEMVKYIEGYWFKVGNLKK